MVNTEHLYAGEPDGRQMVAGDEAHVSRFRERYRALSAEEKARHDAIKAAYRGVEQQLNQLHHGRYRALAFTCLEESCMWAIKELTS